MTLRYELLTPAGRGAVATIVIEGESTTAALAQHFQPLGNADPKRLPIDRIVFGRWRREGATAGEDLVVCRTSEQQYEIHCHGGAAAVEAIQAELAALGGTAATGLLLAGLPQHQAEALAALPHARTQRTAAILLDQYRGALVDEFAAIETLLVENKLSTARERIERLASRIVLGAHLTEPFRVIIAGPPNVGKSSLINALLGYDRAIVFDQPGTTRDVVNTLTAFDGWPVELSDTAGLRPTGDVLEAAGVDRARRQLASADLIVWVQDASDRQPVEPPPGGNVPVLLVWNKIDLAKPPSAGMAVSALARVGLDELQRGITSILVPDPPTPGEAIPYLPRHLEMLTALRQRADA